MGSQICVFVFILCRGMTRCVACLYVQILPRNVPCEWPSQRSCFFGKRRIWFPQMLLERRKSTTRSVNDGLPVYLVLSPWHICPPTFSLRWKTHILKSGQFVLKRNQSWFSQTMLEGEKYNKSCPDISFCHPDILSSHAFFQYLGTITREGKHIFCNRVNLFWKGPNHGSRRRY